MIRIDISAALYKNFIKDSNIKIYVDYDKQAFITNIHYNYYILNTLNNMLSYKIE